MPALAPVLKPELDELCPGGGGSVGEAGAGEGKAGAGGAVQLNAPRI